MTQPRPTRRAAGDHGITAGAMIILAGLSITIAGCRNWHAYDDPDFGGAPRRASEQAQTQPMEGEYGPAPRRYLVDADTARESGYRIDWQVDTAPSGGSGIQIVSAQGESIFVLDGRNNLSRLQRDDGARIWRLPVGEPGAEVLGVTLVPELERVYLTTGGSLLVLDALTGSPVGRQRFEKVANTEPVRYGPYLIYGARNGELVWHSHAIEFLWRGYQVSRSIQMRPVIHDGYVVTVGNDGTVMVLRASSATQMWSKRLLDEVVALPDVGNQVVYLAGRDQYVYAFDIESGRTLWSALTTSPLSEPPVLIDGAVYQQIPGEGLVCFDALPLDKPGGQELWRAAETNGTVLTRHRDRLLVWDSDGRVLTTLTESRGSLVERAELPDLDSFISLSKDGGDLLGWSNDGRLIRLVPKN